MSNDEKRDIEDRINDAMAKIVSDTAGEPQPENKNNRSAAHKSARPSKSARPRKITYVPIDESEFEPIVIPEKKINCSPTWKNMAGTDPVKGCGHFMTRIETLLEKCAK